MTKRGSELFARVVYTAKRFMRRLHQSVRVRRVLGIPRKENLYAPVRIEITGSCNAKCTYCHSGPVAFLKDRYIDPVLFERVLNHLDAIGINMADGVYLYDRGEPLLHKKLGELLDILDRRGLKANISTNASRVPKLTRRQWSVIKYIKFSICGLTPETYKRIYGLNVDIVKKNIEEIARRANFRTGLSINWLRYTFNIEEEKEAGMWAQERGIKFAPKDAYFIVIEKMVALAEGKVSPEEIKAFKKDILPSNYPQLHCEDGAEIGTESDESIQKTTCAMWKQIIIDDRGELLLCCGLAPWNTENRLGNIFDMALEDVIAAKHRKTDICTKCIKYGFAQTQPVRAAWEHA